jgi:hypothetical protein
VKNAKSIIERHKIDGQPFFFLSWLAVEFDNE